MRTTEKKDKKFSNEVIIYKDDGKSYDEDSKSINNKNQFENLTTQSIISEDGFNRATHTSRNAIRRKKKRELRSKDFIHRFLASDTDEYVCLKMLLSIPLGLCIAYLIYSVVLSQLGLEPTFQNEFATVFITFFTVCFVWSVSVRCVVALMVPMMFSECGRLYMYILLTMFLLKGPLGSFFSNSHEVFRSALCGVELLANQTRMLCTVKLVPLLDVIIKLVENQNDFLRMVNVIRLRLNDYLDDLAPAGLENLDISGDSTTFSTSSLEGRREAVMQSKITELFIKLQDGCEEMLTQAEKSCNELYDKLLSSCMSFLLLFFALCYIINHFRRCNLYHLVNEHLHMSCQDIATTGEQSDLAQALKQMKDMLDDFFEHFDAQYQFENPNDLEAPDPNLPSVYQIKAVMDEAFTFKGVLLEQFIIIIRRCFPFLFIFLLFKAHQYLDSYLTDITFDNTYINSYFLRIDNRRKLEMKNTLMPLKHYEKEELMEVMSHKLTLKDTVKLLRSIRWVVVFAMYLLVFYAMDYLLAQTLILFNQHVAIDYEHKGRSELEVSVTGDGLLAKVMKVLTKRLNLQRSLHIQTSNRVCLPHATTTDISSLLHVQAFLLCIVAFYAIEPYLKRYNHLVAAFFFRKREKARIIYLYNNIRRRRVGYSHQARHVVRKNIRNNKFHIPIGFMLSLRYAIPGYFEWLTYFNLGLQECTICKEPESPSFRHCPTFLCKATYCRTCWLDIGFRCYACKDDDDWSDSSGGDSVQDGLDDAI